MHPAEWFFVGFFVGIVATLIGVWAVVRSPPRGLLWIGMEVGLDPIEKDEATALFLKYGDGEAFTGSLHEIIGVDMAKGPDATVTQSERSGERVNRDD